MICFNVLSPIFIKEIFNAIGQVNWSDKKHGNTNTKRTKSSILFNYLYINNATCYGLNAARYLLLLTMQNHFRHLFRENNSNNADYNYSNCWKLCICIRDLAWVCVKFSEFPTTLFAYDSLMFFSFFFNSFSAQNTR